MNKLIIVIAMAFSIFALVGTSAAEAKNCNYEGVSCQEAVDREVARQNKAASGNEAPTTKSMCPIIEKQQEAAAPKCRQQKALCFANNMKVKGLDCLEVCARCQRQRDFYAAWYKFCTGRYPKW